ncbi:MAG: leucyl aminopeptidase family protein [Pseudomonadota bacterium]
MGPLTFAPPGDAAIPLYAVAAEDVAAWCAGQPDAVAQWAKTTGFRGGAGQLLTVAAEDGTVAVAAAGLGDESARRRTAFHFATARTKLPAGTYRLVHDLPPYRAAEAALGWLLQGYRFGRYAAAEPPGAHLVAPDGVDTGRIEQIAAGEALTRDLINTPSADMGPAELATAARDLAERFGASFSVITGDALLAEGFPLIHTVGRASPRAPRLIDITWGTEGPRLTLVGKGVRFDTGGLNLKPGASMGLMKKDMGGAATVLGLAQMIMASALQIRLRVLIPAVENSIGGAAFRPQDVLTSRKGLTVEINNTDAEGRLVLADALALAAEDAPDLIVSMATLTGAARVAVGPGLAPFFTDDEGIATALASAGAVVRDPVWRMPFWDGYEAMIEPGIADLDNAPKGGFAGAITAALFLRRFVGDGARYLHFDIYGWQPSTAPARPKGGVGQGARALFEALPEILG